MPITPSACFVSLLFCPPPLQDATLQELYLSQTSLSGALPDAVPPNSPLRLLYAINFIQPERTGFTGVATARN
jgi:hypothetical protein